MSAPVPHPKAEDLCKPMAMRYDYLDGLRGLAVAGVVAPHVGQTVPGRSMLIENLMIWSLRGVDLFFLVSALTLLMVTRTETFAGTALYNCRFFRIAPMFYTAASWAGWRQVTPIPPTGWDMTLTLLFLHGFNPHGIDNVVPGGWSIACKATFYIIFPLLLSFSGRAPSTVSSVAQL